MPARISDKRRAKIMGDIAARLMTEQQRLECEGVLSAFTADRPLIVHPAFYKVMKGEGLRMDNVIETQPLCAHNSKAKAQ